MARWGFIGSGSITYRVMADFDLIPNGKLAGVCSRTRSNAQKFADAHGSPRVFGSMKEMLESGEVDIIYVAPTHTQHLASAMEAIEAGFPVLCEKPFSYDLATSRQMVEAARKKGVFLMEAFWTRFFPALRQAREWVRSGRIGALRAITGSLCFVAPDNLSNTRVNPGNAGGALLDIGSYLINFAGFITGERAMEAKILSNPHPLSGVDGDDAFVLRYPSGVLGSFLCSIRSQSGDPARIIGDRGFIEIPRNFNCPQLAVLYENGTETERAHFPNPHGEGFRYEFTHVQECVEQGLLESPDMTLNETLANMALLDDLRRQIDLIYPFEK